MSFLKSFFPAGKSSGLKVYSGGGGSGTEVDLVEDTALGQPHGGRYRSRLFQKRLAAVVLKWTWSKTLLLGTLMAAGIGLCSFIKDWLY